MHMIDQLLCNCLPRIDDFLDIWIEGDTDGIVLPDHEGADSCFILIYGVTENVVDSCLPAVKARAEELKRQFERNAPELLYDISIKPIFLFESFQDALECHRIINDFSWEDMCDFTTDLQLDHNEPWTAVKTITESTWERKRNEYFCPVYPSTT